jgi:hypothetical protein
LSNDALSDKQEEAHGQMSDDEQTLEKGTILSHISYVEQVCKRQEALLGDIVSTKRQVKVIKKTLKGQ